MAALTHTRTVLRAAMGRGRFASTLAVDNPYTGETYCEVGLSNSAEMGATVDRAAAAQRTWAAETSIEERVALCGRFMEAFEADGERVAEDITGMMGKPLKYARGEIGGARERCEGMMALAPKALSPEVLPARPNFRREIHKAPVGVVLCVAPWNYPLLTTVNCVVPAVLAGNSVIVKHSSRTPLCADAFARAFEAAGAPAHLVQALHCGHGVVDECIQRDEVGFVSFTGSVGGGHSIYNSVARNRFIDATLELGGKDPAYVAEDADLEAAAAGLVDGAFFNAGQSCCGIERVYVHESKYDAFLEAAKVHVDAYALGDPRAEATTMGPLAQDDAAAFLKGQVDDAVAGGATLLSGGAPTTDAAGLGRFFAPTLLGDCDHSMEIMTEESFGPVLGVMKVQDDAAAVDLMNDSAYGLSACVFTKDHARAEWMSERVETGTFFQNRCDYLDPELAWTGVKDTGKGVSLSEHGFRGVTRLRNFHAKLDATA